MNNNASPTLRPLMNRRTSTLSEVMTVKASNMQRMIQVMRSAVHNSCISAFKLFCLPLDSLLCDHIICYSAQLQQPKDDRPAQAETPKLQSPPSTILIVNISNSTLIDCIIGSEAHLSAVSERQSLLEQSLHPTHCQGSCSCCHEQQGAGKSADPPPLPLPSCSSPSEEQLSISIRGSQLNYVIIGDNNSMNAEQSTPFDWEPQTSEVSEIQI